MARKPSVTLVGPGNLGRTLALGLHAAGYNVREVVARDNPQSQERARKLAQRMHAEAHTIEGASYASDLTFLCVPDDAIRSCADELAHLRNWKGKRVLHCSGALSSQELHELRQRGAAVGSLHPMMTFVEKSEPSFEGLFFAFEGDDRLLPTVKKLVRDLQGELGILRPEQKPLYHATGSFSSPLLVALLGTAVRVAEQAGIDGEAARRLMKPILLQTVNNFLERGADAAFSGPIKRGDIKTVEKHLRELRKVKGAPEIYRALAMSAIEEFTVGGRKELKKLLQPTRRK